MFKKLLLINTFLVTLSCSDSLFKAELRKLSEKELIEKAKKNDYYPNNPDEIIYRDSLKNIISISELKKYKNLNQWTVDHYVDKEGILKEYHLRKVTKQDLLLKDSIDFILESHYVEKINLIEVDCSNVRNLLNKIDSKNNQIVGSDNKSLQTVVSILENCGMPTLEVVDQKHLYIIWLTLQHNDNYYRKKYFHQIQALVKKGYLHKSFEAMMKDRILVQDGKPQIYGTQVIFNDSLKKWELCPIENPKLLREERIKMGLEPINTYLKKWNLKFEH